MARYSDITKYSDMSSVLRAIQDACALTLDDAKKFAHVLKKHKYLVQITQTGEHNFEMFIPENWAELYCNEVDD